MAVRLTGLQEDEAGQGSRGERQPGQSILRTGETDEQPYRTPGRLSR